MAVQLGWPLPKRRELIRRLAATPANEQFRVAFQGRLQALPIRRIPIEFPKYRLDNGRTQAAQAHYLATHPDLPEDFFSRDLESDEAHKAQHAILKKMITGDGDKDLVRFFKDHQQTEPFILTEEGFVVNGNRRLCALRELLDEDRAAYASFEHIEVVFLPPAEPRDLDRLEANLQITQDIKADYSWTAKAFMLRTRRDEHGFDEAELSDIYEMSVNSIRELMDMLSLAEVYLADRGIPRQYAAVEKAEFAFRQLTKHRRKFKAEAEKEVFERIAYCLIDQPKAAGGRVYAAIPDVQEHFAKVVDALRASFPTPPGTGSGARATLLGAQVSPLSGVAQVLTRPNNFDRVREIVTEVIASENEVKLELRKDLAAVTLLARARANLQDALSALRAGASKNGVADELNRIDAAVTEIRKELNDRTPN